MRSYLFYLCLVAVYTAAGVTAGPPHAHAVRLAKARAARPFGSEGALKPRAASTLAIQRAAAAQPTPVPEAELLECVEEGDDSTTTSPVPTPQGAIKTIVQPATSTRTKTVTRVTGTSVQVLTYTQTLVKTATAIATSAAGPQTTKTTTITSTVTSTMPRSSSSVRTSSTSTSYTPSTPATPTYTTLVTPIPTSLNGVFDGVGSYFYTGLGACGWWSADTDYVVAMQDQVFDNYPGASSGAWPNPICGSKVQINYNGNSVIATVVDRCAGCELYQTDMSPSTFQVLAPLEVGWLTDGLTWSWLPGDAYPGPVSS